MVNAHASWTHSCLGLTVFRLGYIHREAQCSLATEEKTRRVNVHVINVVLVESASMYALIMAALTVAAFLGSNAYYLIGGVVSLCVLAVPDS